MISFDESKILQQYIFAQKLYIKGTNLGILKFESFKAKLAHAKSQIDHWNLTANNIYIHPSNRDLVVNFVKVSIPELNKELYLKQIQLFEMNVNFSMFVCNDDCIVADVSVPISDRSVIIFKI